MKEKDPHVEEALI